MTRLPLPALVALLLLCLAGCVNQPHKAQVDSVEALNQWQLDGKIAIKMTDFARSAYFGWENTVGSYQISVNGPLGQGRAELSKQPEGVTLRYDGEKHQAQSAETLMYEHLGWSFPVDNMQWWIKGLPAPDTPPDSITYNNQGQISELSQHGWRIRYLQYQTALGLTLPYKITAENLNLQLTVLLKKWQLNKH